MTTGRINQVALPPPPGGSDYINRLLYNPSSFGLFLTSMTFYFLFFCTMHHTSPVFSPFRVNNTPEKKPKHTLIHVPKGGPFPPSLSLSASLYLLSGPNRAVKNFSPFFPFNAPRTRLCAPPQPGTGYEAQGPFF